MARNRHVRRWAQPDVRPALVTVLRSAKLLRYPQDRTQGRRAIAVLRCLDLRCPELQLADLVAPARLLALVRWLRPVDLWAGGSLDDLVDHLVRRVPYALPPFLYRLVREARYATPDARRSVRLLARLGAGEALHDVVPGMTRRAAHVLWNAPPAATLADAVMRAKLVAAGGPEWLAAELTRGVPLLGRWDPVLAWLAGHAEELPRGEIRAIFDYFRAHDAPALVAHGPSAERIVREARAWHERRHHAFASGALPASGLKGADAIGADGAWSIVELRSGEALTSEGIALRHCVATYFGKVASGLSSIWSLRRDGVRCLTVEVRNADRRLVQIRGMRNRRAVAEELGVLGAWAAERGLGIAESER